MAGAKSYNWGSCGVLDYNGISLCRSETQIAHVRDGTTQTYMLGEKYLMSDHYSTGMDPADDHGMYEGCGPDTFRWCEYYGPDDGNNRVPRQDIPNVDCRFCFGSAHAGGCNFVFCDGSVHTISYSIDPITHSRLGNRKDHKPVDSSKF